MARSASTKEANGAMDEAATIDEAAPIDESATIDEAEAAIEADEPSPFADLEPEEGNGYAESFGEADDMSGGGRLDLVFDVPVSLSVELGRTDVPIREVVNLSRGSIIELDRGPGTPLDVRVNGVLIGRGEIVLINAEKLGLRFVEVVNQAERAKRSD